MKPGDKVRVVRCYPPSGFKHREFRHTCYRGKIGSILERSGASWKVLFVGDQSVRRDMPVDAAYFTSAQLELA